MDIKVKSLFLKSSPRKVRPVLHGLRGMVLEAALVELKFTNKSLVRHRGDMYFDAEKYDKAVVDYTELIMKYGEKKNDTIFLRRGSCYNNLGKYDLANTDFNKAITYNRENTFLYVYRAENKVKQKNYTAAQIDLNKALSVDSKNLKALELRAQIYFNQNKFLLAIEDLNYVIKIKPTSEAYYQRAVCKQLSKDPKGPCEDLIKAATMGHEESKRIAAKNCGYGL